MGHQHLGPQSCADANSPQAFSTALYGYQFRNGCDNHDSGYRTVTVFTLRGLGATQSARGLQRFDRRLRCRTASNSFLPWASSPLLPLAVSRKKKHQYTLSRSRLSQCTLVSTSNIVAGRAFASAPNFTLYSSPKNRGAVSKSDTPRKNPSLIYPNRRATRRTVVHLSRSQKCPTLSNLSRSWASSDWSQHVVSKKKTSSIHSYRSQSIRHRLANTSNNATGQAVASAPRFAFCAPQPEGTA